MLDAVLSLHDVVQSLQDLKINYKVLTEDSVEQIMDELSRELEAVIEELSK